MNDKNLNIPFINRILSKHFLFAIFFLIRKYSAVDILCYVCDIVLQKTTQTCFIYEEKNICFHFRFIQNKDENKKEKKNHPAHCFIVSVASFCLCSTPEIEHYRVM